MPPSHLLKDHQCHGIIRKYIQGTFLDRDSQLFQGSIIHADTNLTIYLPTQHSHILPEACVRIIVFPDRCVGEIRVRKNPTRMVEILDNVGRFYQTRKVLSCLFLTYQLQHHDH